MTAPQRFCGVRMVVGVGSALSRIAVLHAPSTDRRRWVAS